MKRYPVALAILVLAITLAAPILQPKAYAVSASDWKAGRIIDDEIFTNSDEMSTNDIQIFLNSKVPACDTSGTKPASEYGRPDLTHAQYAALRGWAGPPYVCLRDYYEVPKTSPSSNIPASNFSGSIPAGAVSAAQLIYNASQQYHVNSKVLLVMIQKESPGPLTTDTWPLASQYRYALGAHCPDSTGCDPNYAGFSIQILESAKLLRGYIDNMIQPWWQYRKPYQTNNLLFHPTASCGSSGVYIDSKATAALYTYTPYQPNAAAIANMYGTGDSCSSYGNRNFWRIYNDWFGSSLYTPPYRWSYIGQEAYKDLSFSNPLPKPYNFTNGQRIFYTIVARNTGTATWTNYGPNPIKLGTLEPNDRLSSVCDSTWRDCARPALLSQSKVEPGQIGTFGFWITTQQAVGTYSERLGLVAEGLTWLNDTGLSFDYNVIPSYRWAPLSTKFFRDQARTKEIANGALVATEKSYVTLTVQNTGNMTWVNSDSNPIRLASLYDRQSRYCDPSWVDCARVARLNEATVAPGATGTFNFEITNPKDPSYYGDSFNLVIEGSLWMTNNDYRMWLATAQPIRSWSIIDKKVYIDSNLQQLANLDNITRGQHLYYSLLVKNTGNSVWLNTPTNPIRLGTYAPRDHKGVFYDSRWIDSARAAQLKDGIVYPGDTTTIEFWATAPTLAGNFNDSYNLVSDGKYWMDDSIYRENITVKQ